MKTTYKNNISKFNYPILLFLMGGVFLLIFSLTTSPITCNSWGSDSAFFQYVGFCASKGQVPYRDIFDTKGPYIFLIQQLAYTLGGSYGRYVLLLFQLLCMTVSLSVLDASCRLFHPDAKGQRILSALLFFFLLSYSIDGGNLTEEYALPLLLLCQYLMLKTLHNPPAHGSDLPHEYPVRYAVVYGGCFGILVFSRITNSCLLFCIVLFLLLIMLAERQWGQIVKNMFAFLAGTALTTVPILLWYAFQGALEDMLYATYLMGFSYATEAAGQLRMDTYLPLPLLCLAAVLGAYLSSKLDKLALYLGICLAAHTIILLLGNAYIHYYQLIIPPSLCAFWYFTDAIAERPKRWRNGITGILLVIIILAGTPSLILHGGRVVAAVGLNTEAIHHSSFGKFSESLLAYSTGNSNYGYITEHEAKEILSHVPPEGQHSIYSNSPTWLLLMDRLCPCKYCETPNTFMMINPDIYREMEAQLSAGKWDYLVLCNTTKEEPFLKQAMGGWYQLTAQNESYLLYKYTGNSRDN